MPSTTEIELRKIIDKEKKQVEEETAKSEEQTLIQIIERGMKTAEMLGTDGWKMWEEDIRQQIQSAEIRSEDIDPVKKPTMLTRYLERRATFRELLTYIYETIEMKDVAMQQLEKIKKGGEQ